ncbi:hypothetical protein HPB49_019324 [Dermacentor silvarum]|uniref:Uncharacterized protein n=1 Tax=Dermacentor silvarum TaxID=543639 RepID=A0ACB8C522_DERSI|nr:hypothetical protein HPB49_019324 [Dermacentor silvarum]
MGANVFDKVPVRKVGEALYEWFLCACAINLPITRPILATKVKQFALVDFQPGGGWVQRFREKHGIVYKAVTGEGASLDVEAKQKWVEVTFPLILNSCTDTDVSNGDETGLFFQMLPSKMHVLKGDVCKGGKYRKLRLTAFLRASIDGNNRCPAFVIGKSKYFPLLPFCCQDTGTLPSQPQGMDDAKTFS